MRPVLCALALFVLVSTPAFPWGAEGHEAVCEIAYQELTSEARQEVRSILAAQKKRKFSTFRQACVWPDHGGKVQKQHKDDHYTNVPRHWTSIQQADCYGSKVCLFEAIERDARTVADSSKSDYSRLVALMFLGHWVGDLHQPLHVSFADDKGGNYVTLKKKIGCRRKLHDVWDNCMPEYGMRKRGLKDRERYGQVLHGEIQSGQRRTWTSNMDLASWASESFWIARLPSTEYCILKGSECWFTNSQKEYQGKKHWIHLTPSYVTDHVDNAEFRIKQAGVRLGALLNDLLEP